ncbi:peptidylprolyl isomerase [Gudongella sp. DL1XJH-153]|uniref:peptidylprolyl isomerase n=1 Tax=Gudongella sp. DL1XJH-153 TaxID=3409804 RepID=UPI003BB5E0CA
MTEQQLVAVVNGKEISREEVLKFLNDMGPQVAMQFQSPEGIKRVIEEMVNQELLYLDALEQNMEEEAEFKETFEATKKNLLKGYAFNKLVADIDAEEEEMKEFFQENKNVFGQPETLKASHILVEDEDKAKEVIQELNDGLNFEEAAANYSSCPSKEAGGTLGEFGRGQMVPEFEDAAFNMEVGTISEPVKTQFGYHIIRVDAKNEAEEPAFEEVKEQVQQQVLARKQEAKYQEKISGLKVKYPVEIY